MTLTLNLKPSILNFKALFTQAFMRGLKSISSRSRSSEKGFAAQGSWGSGLGLRFRV